MAKDSLVITAGHWIDISVQPAFISLPFFILLNSWITDTWATLHMAQGYQNFMQQNYTPL